MIFMHNTVWCTRYYVLIVSSFFSCARGTDYDSTAGWPELLAPLMCLPLSRGDRYNCFYSLISRYVFKSLGDGGVAFPIFRLLILYHDPEVNLFSVLCKISSNLYGFFCDCIRTNSYIFPGVPHRYCSFAMDWTLRESMSKLLVKCGFAVFLWWCAALMSFINCGTLYSLKGIR